MPKRKPAKEANCTTDLRLECAPLSKPRLYPRNHREHPDDPVQLPPPKPKPPENIRIYYGWLGMKVVDPNNPKR